MPTPDSSPQDDAPMRPPLAVLGESTDSSGSSSTLTGITSPTLSNASDPPSFSRTSSLLTVSNPPSQPREGSPSHEKRLMSRRQRPSTAPAGGDSPASRPPLLPSQPTVYYDAADSPVVGFSISRGRSPGAQNDPTPTSPSHGRASSARSRPLLTAAKDSSSAHWDNSGSYIGNRELLDVHVPFVISDNILHTCSRAIQFQHQLWYAIT